MQKNMLKPNIEEGKKIFKNLLMWLGLTNYKNDDSLKDTPERMANMYLELFNGLYSDEPKIKMFTAEEGYVCVTDIDFASMCSHHFLPFFGKVGVVYHSTNDKVIGISKIPRLVKFYSARPQLQEKLGNEIANAIKRITNAKGVYVEISAIHSCMVIRGIKSVNAITNTAVMLGDIDKIEANRLLHINKYFSL